MTEILKNKVASTKTTATTEDEKYRYDVSYEIGDNGKTFNGMSAMIVSKENDSYVGNITWNNGNKTIGMSDGSDGDAINAIADSIISEIKSTLIVG